MSVASIRPELMRRIVWEASAIQAAFPGRFRLLLQKDGCGAWEGAVPVEGRTFPVVVTYPPDYPAQPPCLETTAELPEHCPHTLGRSGGRTTLCWIASFARPPHRRWQPARHTALTVLHAAQRWGIAYLVWKATGVWPVQDAASNR
jgi:ubiquitin-protein ligase